MIQILLIGIGNTLRSDDGAGVHAVQRLAERFPSVASVCVQELLPELAEPVAHCDRLICIDASVSCTQLRLTRLQAARSDFAQDSHAHSLQHLLWLARAVYRRQPRQAVLVEIPASGFAFGESLSPATEAMVTACVEMVGEILANGRLPDPKQPLRSRKRSSPHAQRALPEP